MRTPWHSRRISFRARWSRPATAGTGRCCRSCWPCWCCWRYGGAQMARPYHLGETLPLTLDPWQLPYYLLRTTLRMFIALAFSLLFSFAFAAAGGAAGARPRRSWCRCSTSCSRSRSWAFSRSRCTGFIALFPGNLFGVECAAIFAIFTSQAWNMAFSLYQSMRTVPQRAAGGGARVPAVGVAALLAAGAAVRDAGAAVEHDDVDVGRLVLRGRVRGDLGLGPEHQAARRRLLHRAGDRGAQPAARSAGPSWAC